MNRYVMKYRELKREFDEKELRRLLQEWGTSCPNDVVRKINNGVPHYTGVSTIHLGE